MSAKSMIGTGVLYTDRRQFYIEPYVTKELWTTVAPFTTIVANRQVVTGLADPLFKMFEHRDPWRKQQCTVTGGGGSVPNNDTGLASVTVDTLVGLPALDDSWIGLEFEVWDSTQTTRKGVVLVSAQSSGSSMTLKLLGTTAFTLATGDLLINSGNAQGEGSEAPEAWSDELRVVFGSTQIFETPIEITGTLYRAALRGYSSELERLRQQKAKEHKMQKERAFLFGDSVIGTNLNVDSAETFGDTSGTHTRTVGGLAVRTTMGIVTAIEKYGSSTVTADNQNIFSCPEASYKYSNFVDDMEKVFHYYPEDGIKYALCGPGAISYWSKVSEQGFTGKSGWKVQLSGMKQDSLGFNVRMLETPHGTLALINTPALMGPRNKYMVVLSDENLKYVQYEPQKFLTNIKTENAYKGVKDVYQSDEGIGMTLIESHSLFKIV